MSDDNVSDVPHDTSQTSAPVSDRVDLSTWLTKQQAADAIGVSTKAIERFTQAGKLEQRLRPQAHGPKVAVYFPEDVAKLAQERQPGATPFVLPAGPEKLHGSGNGSIAKLHQGSATSPPETATLARLPNGAVEVIAAFLQAVMSQTSQTSPETPWVDIPTAATILNRSQAYVRRQIAAGALHAERDRCLMVRRKDLEAL